MTSKKNVMYRVVLSVAALAMLSLLVGQGCPCPPGSPGASPTPTPTPTPNPCDGVTCDPGEECVDGVCVPVDPCEGVTCDPGEECVDGVCVPIDACEGVTCDPGEECVDGVCVPVDPCEGVTCDPGEECVDGVCVPSEPVGDPVAGQAFYESNGCAACHGPNGNDGFAPSLVGLDATTICNKISGGDHAGGAGAGATPQDCADLAAFLAP